MFGIRTDVDTLVLAAAVAVTGTFSALMTCALTGRRRRSVVQGLTVMVAMALCLAAGFYVRSH